MLISRLKTGLACLGLAVTLSGCFSFGDNFTVRTKVNADGSLDRTVSFSSNDSISRKGLQFGAADSTGWTGHVEKNPDSTKDGKFNFALVKHYGSTDEANEEVSARTTGYRISSSIVTQYRWFFTTTLFKDTYSPTMTFANVSADEFYTEEDLRWLDAAFRGDSLVTADTVRGAMIQDKLESYMAYGWAVALTRELGKQMAEQGIPSQWFDTLKAHTKEIGEFTRRTDANEETIWIYLIDSLKAPIAALRNTKLLRPDDVLANAPLFDEIEHIIEMPSTITHSNSLLVNQNRATWYLTPYAGVKEGALYVESRKLNYPEILGTLVAVAVLFIFLRRKRSQ